MRVALFTPYSPEIGGGSVQFRSLLPELRDLGIDWYYLAENSVAGEHRQCLGTPFSSSQLVSDLCARTGFLPGSTRLARNLAKRLQADVYWVVAHNEGVCVAAELCSQGKSVHLTVHDDPIAMFQRSRKHRIFAPLMSHHFSKLLKSVESIDVISTFMRDAYQRRYGVDSTPVYRYVPELPKISSSPARDTLTIGLIGSVYQAAPFRHFLSACQDYAAKEKRALKVVRIGSSPEIDVISSEHPQLFETHGELAEQQAISVLASCDLLYAMYPDGNRSKYFRQTSVPMKLSTYVQSQRPIFAHAPSDSTLARLVEKYKLGVTCASNNPQAICGSLQDVLAKEIPRERFEQIRSELMGSAQIELLRNALMMHRGN